MYGIFQMTCPHQTEIVFNNEKNKFRNVLNNVLNKQDSCQCGNLVTILLLTNNRRAMIGHR